MECSRLVDALAGVPDPRKRRGVRYPFLSLLCLVCVAMLCDCDTYAAIAQWGRDHEDWVREALGFCPKKSPCAGTLFYVLSRIDREKLEAALGAWAETILAGIERESEAKQAYAGDGKTLRGSRKQGAPGAHILSLVSHGLGLTLTQRAVDDKRNEISAVLEVIETVALKGRVVTLDALHTQRKTAAKIVAAGGDYVLVAKNNQAGLRADIEREFAEVSPQRLPAGYTAAQTTDLGHGRIEKRSIVVSTRLEDYLNWPSVRQVFQIERVTVFKKTGEKRMEFTYGLTSLGPDEASAANLLAYNRGHWTIENRSHYVRDVTFDEDRRQVRAGSIPQVLAAVRNAAISVLRLKGSTNIAASRRRFAARPREAMGAIGLMPDF